MKYPCLDDSGSFDKGIYGTGGQKDYGIFREKSCDYFKAYEGCLGLRLTENLPLGKYSWPGRISAIASIVGEDRRLKEMFSTYAVAAIWWPKTSWKMMSMPSKWVNAVLSSQPLQGLMLTEMGWHLRNVQSILRMESWLTPKFIIDLFPSKLTGVVFMLQRFHKMGKRLWFSSVLSCLNHDIVFGTKYWILFPLSQLCSRSVARKLTCSWLAVGSYMSLVFFATWTFALYHAEFLVLFLGSLIVHQV